MFPYLSLKVGLFVIRYKLLVFVLSICAVLCCAVLIVCCMFFPQVFVLVREM